MVSVLVTAVGLAFNFTAVLVGGKLMLVPYWCGLALVGVGFGLHYFAMKAYRRAIEADRGLRLSYPYRSALQDGVDVITGQDIPFPGYRNR